MPSIWVRRVPEVEVEIAGRSYRLGCGDGEESHLRSLARRIDGEAARLIGAMGQLSEGRLMLMCALLMADKLSEVEQKAADLPDPGGVREAALAHQLTTLAERLEALIDRIERPGAGV